MERWKTTRKDDVVRDGEKIEWEEVADATLEIGEDVGRVWRRKAEEKRRGWETRGVID